ncbi:hypothetical protein HUZ36_14055 [Pseudoalteromonas sp. McH1-7]|uniref:Uncharacterized protein n=1 Tax=Pseudoalteromonas peptidolytica F12-50-A1 TaxID=1315280 RepID=A0A8I0MYJ7_9GAMM|nr:MULTISPECIES: hypothetical protein [Pseudoalteromonas]MBE0347858.1 hypothetical protein [Pseudoalteromonas peptidolytica F12-50-A1]MDW7551292.1 hypothetical protein [Pseudoalteromonas peptidolytica]NLR15342.1 hypothetical protein [Pseudoalteromonas peptidolytica]NUZ11907.1 hypothetical protein [Pseudoalteromonas sp. McH1-7]RRS09097.1 hypothetical protein EAG18_08230 [Pseudoalteromonas sp. J010]
MASRKSKTDSAATELATLVSTLNHPVVISYDGDATTLPPRGRINNINPKALGALPKGVRVS